MSRVQYLYVVRQMTRSVAPAGCRVSIQNNQRLSDEGEDGILQKSSRLAVVLVSNHSAEARARACDSGSGAGSGRGAWA